MAFEHLDLDPRSVVCFGYDLDRNRCWTDIAEESVVKGWRHVDVGALEASLAENVEACYSSVARFGLNDPATDMRWRAAFDNDAALWTLCLDESQGTAAEVLPEQKEQFFASEAMKKIAAQAADYLYLAKRTLDEIVMRHVQNGELLKVNDVKLQKVEFYISNPRGFWTENFKKLKFKY